MNGLGASLPGGVPRWANAAEAGRVAAARAGVGSCRCGVVRRW